MRTAEELVFDVANDMEQPLGPAITAVLVRLIEELDKRYDSKTVEIEGFNG
jgi:hypothetical protein